MDTAYKEHSTNIVVAAMLGDFNITVTCKDGYLGN